MHYSAHDLHAFSSSGILYLTRFICQTPTHPSKLRLPTLSLQRLLYYPTTHSPLFCLQRSVQTLNSRCIFHVDKACCIWYSSLLDFNLPRPVVFLHFISAFQDLTQAGTSSEFCLVELVKEWGSSSMKLFSISYCCWDHCPSLSRIACTSHLWLLKF